MITKMTILKKVCDCGKRADYSVERTNEDLPDKYCKFGTRKVNYCADCLPPEVKDFWNSYIPDMPARHLK